MTHYTHLVLVVSFSALLGTSPLQAGPIDPGRHPHPEHAQAVHEAEHAVDHAWEVYHRAALGGTIASPALQVEIEQHLHEARTLVTQAQEAAERGDRDQVQRLVGQIQNQTSLAIEGSKEHKK
ncbi:MAG TPA: hypothetical protein VKP13_02655 [Nitrospira sp.]|nr:hypothetical protein [Nitrospira sp.]